MLSGECTLAKNRAFASKSYSELCYDQDLGFFKVISQGQIWMSFKAHQISGSEAITSGSLLKRHHVNLAVKYPNGDEYTLMFMAPTQTASMEAKVRIDNLARVGQATAEVQRLLRVKERVHMSEVTVILSKYGLPNSTIDSKETVEGLITSALIDGVMEGETFVSRLAKQRETVSYQVVTSFDVAKDGIISLKCPNCGSPVQMSDSSQKRKCRYCGSDFTVPQRILDML